MSKVLHHDINSESRMVINPHLENWDLHRFGSNILTVVRDIDMKFNNNPPLPEKYV